MRIIDEKLFELHMKHVDDNLECARSYAAKSKELPDGKRKEIFKKMSDTFIGRAKDQHAMAMLYVVRD